MKAMQFWSKDEPFQIKDIPLPVPQAGQVLIQLQYAALNHLDLWMWKEKVLDKPVIPGSDGSGTVREVGPGVAAYLKDKEVIINPGLYWGDNEKVPGNDFEILGNPTNGTFAEYIVIPAEYVYEKPAHLSLQEAAALPLAALTAYRALFTKAQLTPHDKVLITGIGGGAALFLLQIAIASGATAYVTSSSHDKIEKAIALGAAGGFNYKEKDWVEKAMSEAGGFDVIIDSAGGNGFASLTELANPAARMVLFGRTAGNINNLRPSVIFNKQLEIKGTMMGSSKEFAAMLAFYNTHQLHPILDKEFPLMQTDQAFGYMEEGNHFGKIMIAIG